MKTLYLLRHAKVSQHHHNNMQDIDRPLVIEGIENMQKVSNHLKESGIEIRHIVTSPATRTMQTADIVAKTFNLNTDSILIYQELYKPDIPAFEDCIFSLSDNWDHVVIVSHNPGISDFANSLHLLNEEMATSAVLSLSFDTDKWIDMYAVLPVFNFYVTPKSLAKR